MGLHQRRDLPASGDHHLDGPRVSPWLWFSARRESGLFTRAAGNRRAMIQAVLLQEGRTAGRLQSWSALPQGSPGVREICVGALASLAAGGLAALLPPVTIGLLLLAVAVGGLAVAHSRGVSPFHAGLFALIGGYIVLNRGFAGLYLPLGSVPLYIGEIGLALALIPTLRRLRGQSPNMPALALFAWMAFNALLTLPHLAEYGLVAVRDAAIWYYGLYALVGAAAWQGLTPAAIRRGFLPIFLLAAAALPASLAQAAGGLPAVQLPFSDGPIIGEKWDIATMYLLGAVGLFLTAGRLRTPLWPRWATSLLLGLSLALVALPQHRASFVALIGVLILLVLWREWRSALSTVVAISAVLGLLWLVDAQTPSMRGIVSTRTVIERQMSTLDFLSTDRPSQRDENDSTVLWRTIWWGALWDEAIGNPVILAVGRGYGPDLRDAVVNMRTTFLNWEQNVDKGRPVRSPHNIAMTVLARSGVVGLLLWLLVLGLSFQRIAAAVLACRRAGERDSALFGTWMASFLVAILLVSLFGVVLENPAGAIPFFFLLGLSVTWASEQLARLQSRREAPVQEATNHRPSERPRRAVDSRWRRSPAMNRGTAPAHG